jgi:hypothetical protein
MRRVNSGARRLDCLLHVRMARLTWLACLFGSFVLMGYSKMVIGMSSNRNMALDTFRQVANAIMDNDFLKDQVKQIRYANGQESITTLKGNRYQIVAATRDGSRGLPPISYSLMNYVKYLKKAGKQPDQQLVQLVGRL